MLSKLFPRLYVRPLTEQVRSRDAVKYLDRGMQVCGWIPPKSKRWQPIYFVWTVITTVMVIMLFNVSLFISYFKDLHSFTAGQFLTSLQVGVNTFGSSIKASYTFASVKRFNQAKQLLDRMDERCTKPEQRARIHHTVARCNQIYMLYQVMYCLYTFSTALSSACMGRLPFKLYNPLIDWEASEAHFWLAVFVEYTWMSGIVLLDQMADVYPTNYFMILRTHLVLLKDRLLQLRSDPTMTEDENNAELINCIKDHRLIIEYCNTLRPTVAATICVQFLLIGIIMGLSILNIVFFSNLWTGLGTAVYMFDLVLQTFPFCYTCNLITDDCYELTNCLFHSDWLGADRRYIINLRYFLHNLQQPIVLMAGGVFIISMATNFTVAKLSFSVVTFVKQLNIADKFRTE